jgi:transposase
MEKSMSRPASGDDEALTRAREAIASAQTVEQLRQAQAVVLPLDYAMSMADTAQAIGVSPGWACQLRRRFMQGKVVGAPGAPTPGGRKRQNMSLEEEREFLAPFLESAAAGGVLVVGQIKAALDKRLGCEVALASAYNLLHRHDWRKLAPDKRHPQSDPLAQEEWKKTPRNTHPNPPRLGAGQRHQADVSGRGALWAHLGRAPVLGSQASAPCLPRHVDARIHLRLWRGGCLLWRARQFDPAARQHSVHAVVHQ